MMITLEQGTDDRKDYYGEDADDDAVYSSISFYTCLCYSSCSRRILAGGDRWADIPGPRLHYSYDGLHDCDFVGRLNDLMSEMDLRRAEVSLSFSGVLS